MKINVPPPEPLRACRIRNSRKLCPSASRIATDPLCDFRLQWPGNRSTSEFFMREGQPRSSMRPLWWEQRNWGGRLGHFIDQLHWQSTRRSRRGRWTEGKRRRRCFPSLAIRCWPHILFLLHSSAVLLPKNDAPILHLNSISSPSPTASQLSSTESRPAWRSAQWLGCLSKNQEDSYWELVLAEAWEMGLGRKWHSVCRNTP